MLTTDAVRTVAGAPCTLNSFIADLKLGETERPRVGRCQSWDSHPVSSRSLPQNLPCALGSEPLLKSGVKVLEKGERPSELTGNEELLVSLGLSEEAEMDALL